MTAATVQRRDPLKEVVSTDLLMLAGDLLYRRNQDRDYWAKVPVPQVPSDRVAFEELRQLAVFAPLALVALVYYASSSGPLATMVFLLVAPLMYLMNHLLREAIRKEGERQLARDGGRYAFTQYLCQRLGLQPQEVTLQVVGKMCHDLTQYVEREAPRIRAANLARVQARERNTYAGRRAAAQAAAAAGTFLVASGVADAVAGDALAGMPPGVQFNPATGLPMLNDLVDIHSNVLGTSNMDDMNRALTSCADSGVPETPAVNLDCGSSSFDSSANFGGMDNNGF